MKKLLYSLLVAAMCLGLGGAALGATTLGVIQPAAFSDIAGHEAEGELTLLGAMGVFTGDSGLGGAVKPDDPITRAQFCKVLVAAVGRSSTAAGLAGLQPTFTDGATIPTWAWGSVNVAVYMGIINGYADGSFGPNNPVTYAEAVTMLIRAIPGHAAQVTVGVWPYNFLFYGVDNGFTGSVDVGFANLPCTRGDMARMIVATIQTNKLNAKGEEQLDTAILNDRVYEDTYQEDIDSDTELETVTEAHHVGNLYQGVFNGFTAASSIDLSEAGWQWDDIALGEKVWIVGGASYDALMMQPVFVVLNDDGTYFIWVTGDANVVTGVFDELGYTTTTKDHYDCFVLADGTKVPYAKDVDDHEDMVPGTINTESELDEGDLTEGAEIAITVGDDGLAINFIATEFDNIYDGFYDFIVDITPAAKEYKEGTPSTWTVLDTYKEGEFSVSNTCSVTINGQAAKLADLKEGDVITYAEKWPGDTVYYIIRAHREVIEGTVASTTTSFPNEVHRVTIDLTGGGTKTYVVSHAGGIGVDIDSPIPSKGDLVKYGLDFDGKVLVPIGFETLTPYVLLSSFQEYGTTPPTQDATFDVRGTAKTYKVDDDYIASDEIQHLIGEFLYVEVNSGTGMVDAEVCNLYPLDEFYGYEVYAVDAANGTLTVYCDFCGEIEFIDDEDLVVYGYNADEDLVYIGLAGLKAGDIVLGAECTMGAPIFVLTDYEELDDIIY